MDPVGKSRLNFGKVHQSRMTVLQAIHKFGIRPHFCHRQYGLEACATTPKITNSQSLPPQPGKNGRGSGPQDVAPPILRPADGLCEEGAVHMSTVGLSELQEGVGQLES